MRTSRVLWKHSLIRKLLKGRLYWGWSNIIDERTQSLWVRLGAFDQLVELECFILFLILASLCKSNKKSCYWLSSFCNILSSPFCHFIIFPKFFHRCFRYLKFTYHSVGYLGEIISPQMISITINNLLLLKIVIWCTLVEKNNIWK
jgi:hypothetical protein